MSAQKALPRPRQVTTAGVMGVVGSALLILSLFDAVQRLKSVEMRAAVAEFLAEPPGDGLGVSTAWVLDVLHGVVLFNGALAAVAAVLAVYVVQRHQVARVGFSIAAALLLFTAPLSGGVMAMVVAFAATMLWGRPARDWFAGREPVAAPALSSSSEGSRPDPWSRPSATNEEPHHVQAPTGQHPDHSDAPSWSRDGGQQSGPGQEGGAEVPGPAAYPFGSRPDPRWAPPASDQQPGAPAWAVGTSADPDRRPGSVTVAAVLTWVFAGGTAMVYLLVVAMLMFARQPLVDALQADPQFDTLPMSTDDLLAVLWVMSAISIFWSLSAVALAALAFRRIGWARIGLVISAAAAMLVSLLAFPFGIVHAIAAGATLPLLLGRKAGAWYARTPRSFPPPPGPGGGQPAPPPAYPPAPPHGKQKPPVW
jgi:hypothetical protein